MTHELTLRLSLVLLSVSLLIQGFELYSLCGRIASNTPWSWAHVRRDFNHWPPAVLFILDRIYEVNFKYLILLQLTLAFFLSVIPSFAVPALTALYILIALRFRGNFNGGSDSMSMMVLISLNFALYNSTTNIGFHLVGFYCTVSYFIAGLVKLKNKYWRTGFALKVFLTQSNYSIPEPIQKWAHQRIFILLSSTLVILFECTFPIIWLLPGLTKLYVAGALIFHIINYFCLGLNRFVFAWAATYPALFFCTLNT